MAQDIEVQVQGDFIERLISARPVQALAELIWNGFDGDADLVRISVEEGPLGINAIEVTDNGDAFRHEEAETLFKNLGGSWKRLASASKSKARRLHGEEGKGRFRALALGRTAEWIVTTPVKDKSPERFTITIVSDHPRRAALGDLQVAPSGASKGVRVRITELHKQWRLNQESVLQELTEVFASYLTEYVDATIILCGAKSSP